jgi:hypothetical protein
MRGLVMLLALAVIAAACGGEEARDVQPNDAESGVVAGNPPTTSTIESSSGKTKRELPLTPGDRTHLRIMASTIEASVKRFDRAVRACHGDASCLDRAWAVVVAERYEWYYLLPLRARARNCEPLGYAASGVYGFDLGAKQVDYGDPAEYGTPERRRDYLALVDGLRPVASALRDAAADCR